MSRACGGSSGPATCPSRTSWISFRFESTQYCRLSLTHVMLSAARREGHAAARPRCCLENSIWRGVQGTPGVFATIQS